VLVFEPDARGHSEEWLLHIARFTQQERPPVRVTMVVPDVLARRIAAEVPGAGGLEIMALSPAEIRSCLSANLAFGALARWWLMRRYLARSGANEGFFLCIDSLTLPLALGLGLGRRTASGILFRPSVHYASFDRRGRTARERLRDWRKQVLYPLALKNTALTEVHSLDPYFPVYAREHYLAGEKVVVLPDPFIETAQSPTLPLRVTRFPRDRTAFLLFGELTERKGVIQILRACERLDPAAARRIAILLAGRVDSAIAQQVRDSVRAVRATQPDLWIEIDDRRLSFNELAHTVEHCDVVLAPYQRFVGSSGVLIWAARMLRPVITQRYGLLCRLVREFGLGIAVDTTSPEALADAMEHAVRSGAKSLIDHARARKFLAQRDGRSFAARVLKLPLRAPDQATFTSSRVAR
jgi:glycosyltransferase involved in cell wall biosynthesis